MKPDYRDWPLAAMAVIFLASVSQAAAPPPVEAFGNRPALIDVDLNPSGSRLAWIEDDGSGARVVIHDLVSHKDLRRMNVPKSTRLRAVYWANDDTIIIDERVTHSVRPDGRNADEWQRWAAIDAAGGDDRFLLMKGDREWVTGADLIRRQTKKPGKVFMSTLDFSSTNYRQEVGTRLVGGKKDAGWIDNLYEVDLATGDGRVLVNGTPFTIDWLADENAEIVLRSDLNPTRDTFAISLRKGVGWRELYSAPRCGHLALVSFNADKTAAILRGPGCTEPRGRLWSLPLDGSPMKSLLDDALDVENVILDPLDERVLGAVVSGAGKSVHWLDERAEKRLAGLHRTFADSSITVISRSADSQRVVALVENARQAPIYYLVDYAARTADIINERYPLLNGFELGKVREFRYQARDGYDLLAFLTLPNGTAGKNLPLVVLPHGGPEARDGPGFDWLAQFLASRGYAVLQPQFRGSSGFGRAHADAGRRQWGLRMQDDVTDGVRALTGQGLADPKRVCIAGISYGGYAALAGAAFTPDLYACAASVNGVSNLPAMIGYTVRIEGKESNSLAYWKDHIGSATDAQVIAKSPARNVDAVRVPILLIHATEDTVVPIEQSRGMARALEAARKPIQLVELPGDDHHLSASVTRVRMLRELESFLATHLAAPATAN